MLNQVVAQEISKTTGQTVDSKRIVLIPPKDGKKLVYAYQTKDAIILCSQDSEDKFTVFNISW